MLLCCVACCFLFVSSQVLFWLCVCVGARARARFALANFDSFVDGRGVEPGFESWSIR